MTTKDEPVSDIDYKTDAKMLVESCAELQRQVLIKHTAAILEEMHKQIKERDDKIAALVLTVGTMITWSRQQFGDAAMNKLLKMLEAR